MEKIDLEKDLILKNSSPSLFSPTESAQPFLLHFSPVGLSRRPVSPARTARGPHQHTGPHRARPSSAHRPTAPLARLSSPRPSTLSLSLPCGTRTSARPFLLPRAALSFLASGDGAPIWKATAPSPTVGKRPFLPQSARFLSLFPPPAGLYNPEQSPAFSPHPLLAAVYHHRRSTPCPRLKARR